jgi:hypothetical protein
LFPLGQGGAERSQEALTLGPGGFPPAAGRLPLSH